MKKFLTVSELEQGSDKDPIWALNGSARSELGTAGEVHVGIPKQNGTRIDALYLPQTWLAQCLTDQIPRAQLMASSEFRNAVNSKLLMLITPEYAASINNKDEAAHERRSLEERRRHLKAATAARSISQSGAEIVNSSEIEKRDSEAPVATALTDAFLAFATSLTNKSDIEVVNALRSRGKVSRREARHLLANMKDKPKTEKYLQNKLAPKKPAAA